MADEPDPDRLRALEARLNRVKGQAVKADASVGTGFSQGEVAWRMIIAAGIKTMLRTADQMKKQQDAGKPGFSDGGG